MTSLTSLRVGMFSKQSRQMKDEDTHGKWTRQEVGNVGPGSRITVVKEGVVCRGVFKAY
jgi:hypothetical protein